MELVLDVNGFSDIGTRRKNEDVWASYKKQQFFTIADGMGGHNAGEIAAKEATKLFCEKSLSFTKKKLTKKSIIDHLQKSFSLANTHVYNLGKNNPSLKGLGTTFCCLFFYKSLAIFAHVGDSRIYLLRKNTLNLLTKDHSLQNKLKKQKKLIKNQNHSFFCKNIITRAIGTTATVSTDTSYVRIKNDDLFCLCTDGLSDHVKKENIKNILLSSGSLFQKNQKLIEEAKKNGSCDNITVLLIYVNKIYERKNNLFG